MISLIRGFQSKKKKKKTHKTELTHTENRLARGGAVREWSGNVGGRNE